MITQAFSGYYEDDMSFVNALNKAAKKRATSPSKVYTQANTSNNDSKLNNKAIRKREAREFPNTMTFRQMYFLSRPK